MATSSFSAKVSLYPTEDAYEAPYSDEEDDEVHSDEEDESLPVHLRIKKKHVKLSARIVQAEKIRVCLINQFKRNKSASNEDNPDRVFQDDQLRVLYDELLYHGLNYRSFTDTYPHMFKNTLEGAMFAEYNAKQSQLLWPRDCNAEEVYFGGKENSLHDEFEKRAPFKEDEWQLSKEPILDENDIEPLRKYKMLLYHLMRDCTTHMFVYDMFGGRSVFDDEGFLECEKERFRINECLRKCDHILYPNSRK